MRKYLLPIIGVLLLGLSCEKKEQEVPVTSVSISQPTAEMIMGETTQLKATVLPSNATMQSVTWASSKQSVATVSKSGLVTAIAEGTSTVTASSGGKSASCIVTVSKRFVPVTSVELNKSSIELVEGDSETLTATVKPDDATDKTVTWSTSDANIATVENGKVTAVKEGEVSITAYAGDKSAICKFIVIHDTANDPIVFADDKLKAKLVAEFDANRDGELSYAEAASVTSGAELKKAFGDAVSFSSFDEFQYFTGISSVTEEMFKGWFILTSIVIPKGVKSIGNYAFQGCENLSSVSLPEEVTFIGRGAFYGCKRLESIVLPEGVTSIGSYAFFSCGIKSLIIPEGVTSIESCTFFQSGIQSISIPETVTAIEMQAFSLSSISSIVLPESLTSIGYAAFMQCPNLSSITIPKGVSIIEGASFYNCPSLCTVTISEGVIKIGDSAFKSCYNLFSVAIPEGLMVIGNEAFYKCETLDTITIPESVTNIGNSSFFNCSGLKSIVVKPLNPPSVGSYCFYGTNECPVFVPMGSLEAYQTTQYWSDYADRIQAIVNPSAVDLGLSVKWASFNLGATKPEDYGDYYAWGETEPKENYSWSTYKFGTSSSGPFSKYNIDSSYGTVDNKTLLEQEDDVAHVKLGGSWRMPTYAEWTELRENCTWTWTTQNGVNGRLVTSKTNGDSIFLPAAGYRDVTYLYDAGSYGLYWSSELYWGDPFHPNYAWYVNFNSDNVYRDDNNRCRGFSVRPVKE